MEIILNQFHVFHIQNGFMKGSFCKLELKEKLQTNNIIIHTL